jgi:O-antigen ligase
VSRLPTPIRLLTSAPATVPALVGVLVLLALPTVGEDLAGNAVFTYGAGYRALTWYPVALFLLALLVATAFVLPARLNEVPRPVLIAAGLLAAFAALSYLSILWADQQGEAWDGANRTLLYVIAFCLFAFWQQRSRTAAIVLGAWTLAIIVLATIVLVRLPHQAHPLHSFLAFRLVAPVAYPNGNAATFLMALWPAVTLASRRELPWWLRGVFAGGAVVLADVALLSQSRGGVFTFPVVLILFFVLVPGRARLFVLAVPLAAAIAVTAPRVLHGATRLRDGADPSSTLSDIVTPVVIAALAIAAIVTVAAAIEGRTRVSEETQRRVQRAVGGAAIACALAGVIIGLAIAGDPVARARHAWHSFKTGPTLIQPKSGSRLSAGLGSHRYDFYRVALDSFKAHPLIGIGADNFSQDYLLHGRSHETPRYPHSIELRALAQTGIVGSLLLLGALAAALVAVLRAIRRASPLGRAVAGGAAMVFVDWAVHGSFDWFWEFAGLGAPAFAMLGLACSLAPRPAGGGSQGGLLRGKPGIAVGAVIALVAGASLTLPWLAERDVKQAASSWTVDQAGAFDKLDQAESLNPLSDRSLLIAGSIALRLGDLGRAERDFRAALRRDPRGSYATLELGAIASATGRPVDALLLLERVRALSPRDELAKMALQRVRDGKGLDIAALNQQILTAANQLAR